MVHFSKVKAEDFKEADAAGIRARWLIKREDGAPNFAMRLFEVAPNGNSPHHSHNWEHEVYILEGECQVVCGDERRNVGAGHAVFIPPNVLHQFINSGKATLKFLCLAPHHE
ncbi:MAG: cupin domain-containing protein [Candidatus Bathyarchaeota archaeon]|nr:cupin domain-containing protein [Candidatus Bathyarchaeota archaeon]